MLKVGLIGIGFMGRGHFNAYKRLEEQGFPIKLTAICDIDPDKFKGIFIKGNINTGSKNFDFSKYNQYTDIDVMLDKEELDYVDIVLPSYLHSEVAIKAMNKGIHVLSEKPMGLNLAECKDMIDIADKTNQKLMIAQCVRFMAPYKYLKECIDDNRYGDVKEAVFFRGGAAPKWSYEGWMLDEKRSGGVLFDLHVHDIDFINSLFGKPSSISAIGSNLIEGSGHNAISAHLIYDDDKVVNAQASWILGGDFGFKASYRVTFEDANIVYDNDIIKVYPNDASSFSPEMDMVDGVEEEIKYFANSIINNTPITHATPQSTMDTIKILESEKISADNKGQIELIK